MNIDELLIAAILLLIVIVGFTIDFDTADFALRMGR